MVSPSMKLVGLHAQYEEMLHHAVMVTEMAMELKDRAQSGEKYLCYLRNLAMRASRIISTMNTSGKTFILLGQRLTMSALRNLETSSGLDHGSQGLKQEYERLLTILDKEAIDIDDLDSVDANLNNDFNNVTSASIRERLRRLEAKQKYSQQMYLRQTSSTRSFRPEVDEKYPENWSRESLIDLNNVMNLPTVPEDVFTSFAKPVRSSSLSSLKSIRKVKLYLQRAVNSEDEESEYDEHEMSDEPTSSSDGGEIRYVTVSTKKAGGLCNIKEEASQEP